MTNYKQGDRVKVYYKADGSYGMGTIGNTAGALKEYGLLILPDEFPGALWQLDDFRVEKLEAVESE